MSWTDGGALSRRFAEIERLFDVYYGKERHRGGDAFDWMIEAEERLRQIVHILTRLEALQAYRDENPEDRERDRWTEMHTYTEAFYWIAFRLQEVMNQLGLSFKAIGVRDVRNHLIEHPEGKASGVIFGVGIGLRSDVGPVIKAVRRGLRDAKWIDAGLKPNAEEYAHKLERVLRVHLGIKD